MAFFVDVLGMAEIAKPPVLDARGGPGSSRTGSSRRARLIPASSSPISTASLPAWRRPGRPLGGTTGSPATAASPLIYPFGNRLEFLQPVS